MYPLPMQAKLVTVVYVSLPECASKCGVPELCRVGRDHVCSGHWDKAQASAPQILLRVTVVVLGILGALVEEQNDINIYMPIENIVPKPGDCFH